MNLQRLSSVLVTGAMIRSRVWCAVCLAWAATAAGCGFSVPGASSAESTENTSADPGLGATPVSTPGAAPMAMPGMHGATTPAADPGAHGATPGAGATTDPAAAMAGMHGATIPGATTGTATPAGHSAIPGAAPGQTAATPATAGHTGANPGATIPGHAAATPMPGVDPAAVAAAGGHNAATPMPGANANPAGPAAVGHNPATPMPGVAQPGAAVGAQPGAVPGADGTVAGTQSGNRAQQYEEGTPERVVMEFADAIEIGDLEAAGKLISDRARSTLASVRDGTISENELAKLQAYTETLDRVANPRNSGNSVQISYNGGSSKVLTFKVQKTSGGFQISELEIRDKPKRAGR